MSTDRQIFCQKCGRYVGTIRDAKLIKGLRFICPACDEEYAQYVPDDLAGIFGNLFGKRYK
ncbi:MAG: hypothetical protein PHG08_00615 [Bacilli bacterium]|nr:hypothetical protein [Bacilli bacterium]